MHRAILALITALVLFFALRCAFNAQPPLMAAVNVWLPGGGCSGAVVKFSHKSTPFVLTAAHCIDGDTMLVVFSDYRSRPFKVVHNQGGIGTKNDWALLTGDTRGVEPLLIAPKALKKEPALSCQIHQVDEDIPCFISQTDELGNYQMFGRIRPGDSGSPVVVNGFVVGVAHSYMPGTLFSFAAPVAGLKNPLQKSQIQK